LWYPVVWLQSTRECTGTTGWHDVASEEGKLPVARVKFMLPPGKMDTSTEQPGAVRVRVPKGSPGNTVTPSIDSAVMLMVSASMVCANLFTKYHVSKAPEGGTTSM